MLTQALLLMFQSVQPDPASPIHVSFQGDTLLVLSAGVGDGEWPLSTQGLSLDL